MDDNNKINEVIDTHDTYSCDNCGAQLGYDVDTDTLKCTKCGAETELTTTNEDVVEHEFFSTVEKVDKSFTKENRTISCDNCGKTVEVPCYNLSMLCSSCDSPMVIEDSHITGMMPTGVMKFNINEQTAKDVYHKWVKTRWMAPRALKKDNKLGKLTPRYVPHFTFDADTTSSYTASRGTYYYTGSGKNRQRKIRWKRVSGSYTTSFDDTIVNASTTVPMELINKVGPYKEVVAYENKLLAGVFAQNHQIPLAEGLEQGKKIMRSSIEGGIRRKIGGDVVSNLSFSTNYSNITTKNVLAPIYVLQYHFHHKDYDVLINGQTGKISANGPISYVKVSLLIILSLIIIGLIYLFV